MACGPLPYALGPMHLPVSSFWFLGPGSQRISAARRRPQPQVLRETLDMNRDAIAPVADRIIAKGLTRILGCGLGTSQFVAQVAAGAFWRFAGLDASDIDSLEVILTDRPYAFSPLAFFSSS